MIEGMKIGILTGGGDAPGLNGIIEAACRVLLSHGVEVEGIEDGFEGIFEGRTKKITTAGIENLHSMAGTFLGTSNKSGTKGREEEFLRAWKKLGLQGLIVAGGDGTFAGLKAFEKDMPLIGVPKTIDNDLSGTEVTFGYDTACSVVADAVDALRATADAHRRVLVVETMGRTAGWIALGGGMASFADVVLLPERPYSLARLKEFILARKASGRRGLMVVVAEGAHAKDAEASVAFRVEGAPQAERFGGIAWQLSRWIEKECDWESRNVVLGHLQRARPPTPTDRFLTIEGSWGWCTVYREGRVQRAPITDVMGPARLVESDHRWVKLLESMGCFI
jgi:ATP-dependent phosphofructokinase / diphosphate-dependent phosphofructokinase